jgi:hypothetical protein
MVPFQQAGINAHLGTAPQRPSVPEEGHSNTAPQQARQLGRQHKSHAQRHSKPIVLLMRATILGESEAFSSIQWCVSQLLTSSEYCIDPPHLFLGFLILCHMLSSALLATLPKMFIMWSPRPQPCAPAPRHRSTRPQTVVTPVKRQTPGSGNNIRPSI